MGYYSYHGGQHDAIDCEYMDRVSTLELGTLLITYKCACMVDIPYCPANNIRSIIIMHGKH